MRLGAEESLSKRKPVEACGRSCQVLGKVGCSVVEVVPNIGMVKENTVKVDVRENHAV